jgi:uncharacterized membrane protein (Fun14 family)
MRLSGLQIKSLVVALVVLIAGTGGLAWSWLDRPAEPVPTGVAAPEQGRSIIAGSPKDESVRKADADAKAAQSWSEWASAKGVRFGSGFLGGFLLGFAIRAYVKTVAVVAGVITVLLAAASYFQLFNIDFSAVQQQWASNSEWLLTQADKLKDAVLAHLPSSTAGAVGVFFGTRRK